MSRQKKKNRDYKVSLSFQITIIFISILALSFATCFIINSFFLEKFYVSQKTNALIKIYDEINLKLDEEIDNSDFEIELQKFSDKYSASIVIINSLFEPIKIYSNEPTDRLISELRNRLFGLGDYDDLMEETDYYVLAGVRDERTSTDYIEMWGYLDNGGFFLLRTAVESIKDSVKIANRFLLYVGLGATVLFGVFIVLFTLRISKPIKDLAVISSRMKNLDFEARYEGKSHNEINYLGNNMNDLSDNLKSTIIELKNANAALSKDIEKRIEDDEIRRAFVADVSHELKTPIALIQGYAEGLQEGVEEQEERNYYCDVIIDEAGKMNNMVRKLMDLNEIESGQNSVNIDRFDIMTMIENNIQSADILLRQKDIKVNIYADSPIYVYSDELLIEEVFSNYLSNAINHCESDGEKHIDVSVERLDNKVCVRVFNTGENIPQESIGRIWDKFYKVDKARSREYGGSGVGLSIVKAVMENLHQSYAVTNLEGGVEFLFTVEGA